MIKPDERTIPTRSSPLYFTRSTVAFMHSNFFSSSDKNRDHDKNIIQHRRQDKDKSQKTKHSINTPPIVS